MTSLENRYFCEINFTALNNTFTIAIHLSASLRLMSAQLRD